MGTFDALRSRLGRLGSGRRRPALVCQQAVELVTDYLEQALAPADRSRFEFHLANCPACQAYVEQLRVAIAALGPAGVTEPTDPAVRAQLIDLYHRYRGE